jgi:hypothetical protein
MTYHKQDDSLEGKSFFLYSRKFIPMNPTNNTILGEMVFNFIIKDYAKAIIEKELLPKQTIIRKTSHLNKNDAIEGEIIRGFSVKPIKKNKLVHRGSHKATNIITKKFSFAKIDREWRALLLKNN